MSTGEVGEIKGTLFHFTRSFESLVGILENEFYPHYCLEDMGAWWGIGDSDLTWALPMVCFCDMRLSQLEEHMQVYGRYGIGLTKEWGQRRGLSPLFYLTRESRTVELLTQLTAAISKIPETELRHDNPFIHTVSELSGYFKAYEGDMYRDGEYVRRRFYEEREWRYVPRSFESRGIESIPYRLTKDGFLDEKVRTEANQKVSEVDRLGFDPSDIRYLLVEKEEEVMPLVREIGKIKAKYGSEEVQRLTTRILVSDKAALDY